MKIVIAGCGRVGAVLAEAFDAAGHQVVVMDLSTQAFDRLPSEFRGSAIRGDGTDEDTLRRAGAEDADVFLALTEGDNRNVMAAQVASEKLAIERVVAKINDPVRAAAYAELGIATICRTTMLADAVSAFLGLATSGVPSVVAATGRHHDGPSRDSLGGAATTAGQAGSMTAGQAGSMSAGAAAGREG
jgi:trk system potassium uptake protein TrkA